MAHERGEFIFHAELGHIIARASGTDEEWAALDAMVDAVEARGAVGSARRARAAVGARSTVWA